MILTGKSKEDFEKWLNKEMYYLGRHNFEDRDNNIEDLSDNFQNTLIIEWFDSVGIYIIISPSDNPKNWFYTILGEDILSPFYQIYQSLDDFKNRQEALTEAIKKANEIYNSK